MYNRNLFACNSNNDGGGSSSSSRGVECHFIDSPNARWPALRKAVSTGVGAVSVKARARADMLLVKATVMATPASIESSRG